MPYQVLILDLHIPDLAGIDVLAEIQARQLNVKTIILSGEEQLDSVAPILKLGACDYIRKPFDADQLINSLRNALSRYQLEQENTRMQRTAENNADLYKFLLNASPDLVYMLDENGHFKFANQQLSNLFQYQSDSLMGKPWQAPFENQPSLEVALEHHVNERQTGLRATVAEQFEFRSDIGTKHALELSAIGLYEAPTDQTPTDQTKSVFTGSYGVIRDVTEAKRTRLELQHSRQKFYSLFADSPDAVFIAGLDGGTLIERNARFVALRESVGAKDDGSDSFLWSPENPRANFLNGLATQPEPVE